MENVAYDYTKNHIFASEDVEKPEFVRNMRIAKLRDLVRPKVNLLSTERARLITESYKETEGLPIEIRRAKAFEKILSEMTIYILEGSLILGNSGPTPMGGKLYPEYGVKWLEDELDTISTRPQDPYFASDEVKRELREEIFPYWKGKTIDDIAHGLLPKEINDLEFKLWVWGLMKNSIGTGHLAVDHEKLLKVGLGGLKKIAQEKLDALDYADPLALRKDVFYQAVITSLDAAIKWIHRYADLARDLAKKEVDPQRKKELEIIASNCSWVAENPARTFWEGVQAVYFNCLLLNLAGPPGVQIGRIDQYLYPYLKNELDKGTITKDFAQDILESFFCVVNANAYHVFDKDVASRYAYFSMGITMVNAGGQTRDGRDATNELSHMLLDAEINVRLAAPEFGVRIHKDTPDEFLRHVAEVIRVGTGKPKVFCDETWYARGMAMGYPIEKLRDYQGAWCAESSTAGDTYWVPENGLVFGGSARMVEFMLNNGKSMLTGEQLGAQTGDAKTFASFDEVREAYKKQVAYVTKRIQPAKQAIHMAHADACPNPIVSAFMDDCLEKGLDWERGGARYYRFGSFNTGIAVAGNSLAAIKKLVFDDKVLTMEELVNSCLSNFEGKRGEVIRQMCLNAPKWGNDDDYVDCLTREAVLIDIEEQKKYSLPWGGCNTAVTFDVVTMHLPFGLVVGATPDGRKASDPLNEGGVSPYQGTDATGPTGVMKSIAKLPWDNPHVYGGVLNMKFSRKALEGEDNLKNFMALLRTYDAIGGYHVQFNCIDHETLRDAQQHPEKHRNLMIRVAGYSSYFVELDRVVQDDIIDRTMHESV